MLNSNRASVVLFFIDGLGIGKAKATRLWTEFGPDLHAVLNRGDVEKLSWVLSDECAQALVEAWRTVAEEAEG